MCASGDFLKFHTTQTNLSIKTVYLSAFSAQKAHILWRAPPKKINKIKIKSGARSALLMIIVLRWQPLLYMSVVDNMNFYLGTVYSVLHAWGRINWFSVGLFSLLFIKSGLLFWIPMLSKISQTPLSVRMFQQWIQLGWLCQWNHEDRCQ